MDALSELRILLDKMNIKHWESNDSSYTVEWETPDKRHCSAMWWNPTLTVCISKCTPEQAIIATLGNHPTKSGRGYYTDQDDEGTHIMCDDCGGYIGTAEEIITTLCDSERDQLKTENTKLRELVKSMYNDLTLMTFPPDWVTDYVTDMRELGMEVE